VIHIRLSESQQDQLWSLFRQGQDRAARDRAQAILLLDKGYGRKEAAEAVGVDPRSVRRWVNKWAEAGADGLRSGKAPGKMQIIPEELSETILGWIRGGPESAGLDRANWTFEELATHLARTHRIFVCARTMERFCKRHGVRLYRPSYRFLRADPAKQAVARQELEALKKKRSRVSVFS